MGKNIGIRIRDLQPGSYFREVRPLRNADNFMLPNPRTELFKKSPLYSLPLEWNNLDESRYIRNKNSFKTVIKFSLLNALIDSLQANQPNQ
jgi:hypothetical protein